jgi:hypothetical protein
MNEINIVNKNNHKRIFIFSENQIQKLLSKLITENKRNTTMHNKIEKPEFGGKFEFQIGKEIGQNYKKKNDLYYKFAKKQIEAFTNHFEITDEPMVIEADKNTFIAILAGFYEEFHTGSDKFNFLKGK